jgi:hypothetical protein
LNFTGSLSVVISAAKKNCCFSYALDKEEKCMSAPSYIRRHINNLVGDKPFSIRDFLIYGPRNIVDQVFHRLIVEGCIVRVARGVYIKDASPLPSPLEVIQVKAAAFGRTIALHGSQACAQLINKPERISKFVFATNGATSSFRVGRLVVRLIRVSARKIQLADSPVGLTIRALWHLGKNACDREMAVLALRQFPCLDKKKLRLAGSIMPQWMRDCFADFARMDCLKRDLEPAPIGIG